MMVRLRLKVILLSSNKKQVYNNVVYFDDVTILRVKVEDKKKMKKIIKKNHDIFNNESHFVRCAIIKLLRDYDKNGKKQR